MSNKITSTHSDTSYNTACLDNISYLTVPVFKDFGIFFTCTVMVVSVVLAAETLGKRFSGTSTSEIIKYLFSLLIIYL
jgi:hypothetical protein